MITAKEVKPRTKRTYPYIGRYLSTIDGGKELSGKVTYVRFTSPNKGVLIHTNRRERAKRLQGMSADGVDYAPNPLNMDWNESVYEVLESELVLSNEL